MALRDTLTQVVYDAYLGSMPSPLPTRYRSLSNDQLVSIYAYSTDKDEYSFADINFQLRGRNISPGHWELIREISHGISTIVKDHSAPVYYRYTTLSAAEVAQIYTRGNVSVHAFFTSVSAVNQNFISDKCNVLIRIVPAPEVNPAYIAEIAWAPHEEEFLYGMNTYFTVLSVDERAAGTFEIWLMECVI